MSINSDASVINGQKGAEPAPAAEKGALLTKATQNLAEVAKPVAPPTPVEVAEKLQILLGAILVIALVLFLGGSVYAYRAFAAQADALSGGGALRTEVQRTARAASDAVMGQKNGFESLSAAQAAWQSTWQRVQTLDGFSAATPPIGAFQKAVADLLKLQRPVAQANEALVAGHLSYSADLEALANGRTAAQAVARQATEVDGMIQASLDAIQSKGILQAMPLVLGGLALIVVLAALLLGRQVWVARRTREADARQVSEAAMAQQHAMEEQRRAAQEQEQAAKRVNDANQGSILRLMNELQNIAEGDLTQQATVTEDITGAIADSVNYTVEELRSLVQQVKQATELVARTTSTVDKTSTDLLASSGEQLREIRETGQSVVDMSGRINEVSAQAQQSEEVARQSLEAAGKGLSAVQNAIGGMNAIRDQIQDTAKRIKRLGESSQEIGEITELISDITEQTNVLALNAAIQAASAGEAGRGFSVVAEEVQRLAERSADATRQIAALVKGIQGDTQDAIAAMERSTRGVVEGTTLSDQTGTAFTEIDTVTRKLADLIRQISEQTFREAKTATDVAQNIQHIFAVTEQTASGTRSTAQLVRELTHMAEQLERSVARFRLA